MNASNPGTIQEVDLHLEDLTRQIFNRGFVQVAHRLSDLCRSPVRVQQIHFGMEAGGAQYVGATPERKWTLEVSGVASGEVAMHLPQDEVAILVSDLLHSVGMTVGTAEALEEALLMELVVLLADGLLGELNRSVGLTLEIANPIAHGPDAGRMAEPIVIPLKGPTQGFVAAVEFEISGPLSCHPSIVWQFAPNWWQALQAQPRSIRVKGA